MRQSIFLCLSKSGAVLAGLPLFLFAHNAFAAAATPKYVQGNYADPQMSAATTAIAKYISAQTVSDLNVVIVGWNDATAPVRSVTDSKGNVYRLAVGPTVLSGTVSQAIYYAKNITAAAAGTNSVTVTFSAAAAYPDVRILEYSGIDPVNAFDAGAGATGNSATSTSAAVKTSNATDLLVGANTIQTMTTGPGSGFTQRLLSDPDGDIAEDRSVTATGTYTANAPLNYAGGWVMQVAAFRAASAIPSPTPSPTPTPQRTSTPTPTPKPTQTPTPTPKPTPSPKPTPTPTPTPKPTPTPSQGKAPNSVKLTWSANPPTGNSATTANGYRLHFGIASGIYTKTTNVGNTTTATVSNLTSGLTYYFAITAYNSAGLDGPPSKEVSYKVP